MQRDVNPPPVSLEEAMRRRMERLLQVCIDVSLGTIWRLREDLWREKFRQIGQRYDERSERTWHPGLSLRVCPPVSLHEFVPMLHGSSGDCGPVVARGLSGELGPEHPASFGRVLRPVPLSLGQITSPAPDAPDDLSEGHWFERDWVARNTHKPRLQGEELESLQTWARNRNLL